MFYRSTLFTLSILFFTLQNVSAKGIPSGFRVHTDLPAFNDDKKILLDIFYATDSTFTGSLQVQFFKYNSEDDSILVLNKKIPKQIFRKGDNKTRVDFSKTDSNTFYADKFYQVLKRTESLPPAAYKVFFTVKDSIKTYKSTYLHEIDSSLGPNSPVRSEINKSLTPKSKSFFGMRLKKIADRTGASDAGKAMSKARGKVDQAARKRGLKAMHYEKNNKTYVDLFYQDWFAGRYEVKNNESLSKQIEKQASVPGVPDFNSVNTNSFDQPSLFSQYKALNNDKKRDDDKTGEISISTNVSNGQEQYSAVDNNYCVIKGQLAMPICNVPVIMEGLYTTQDTVIVNVITGGVINHGTITGGTVTGGSAIGGGTLHIGGGTIIINGGPGTIVYDGTWVTEDSLALKDVVTTVCNNDYYRYGYNGQMKTNEMAGLGNWYTAENWEYGTREARRKNKDDKANNPSVSTYSVFDNNPIWKNDPLGDDPSNFEDKDGNVVKHVDDGSNAVFKQTGKGVDQHYEFKGYDAKQGGKNEVTPQAVTSAIQEQQNLNMANPALQQFANGPADKDTHCNQATQDILKTASSALGIDINVTGNANSMVATLKSGGNSNFSIGDYKAAVENANNGGLSLAGVTEAGHGHILTFSVGENIKKGQVANIGPKQYTGFVPLNGAISKSKPKSYFILKAVKQ